MSEILKSEKQRLKILYLYKILKEQTDENNSITMPQIISQLSAYGISAGRKALYDDIKAIKDYYSDITLAEAGRSPGYSLIERDFDLSEVKLLADAVASSHFITEKKSKNLIDKIVTLRSVHEAKQIKRRVYVANRAKSENENILLLIDNIHCAINEKKKITFEYYDYNTKKKLQKRGGTRKCTPYALAWFEDRYYLVAQYMDYKFTHFRVDRMKHLEIIDEKGAPIPDDFNLSKYLKATFSMFSGTEEDVTLRFSKKYVNAVIDRFGKEVMIIPDGEEHFNVHAKVKSEHPEPFFGWLFQFGENVKIVSPQSLKQKYNEMLKNVLKANESE